eukprot:390110-Prorocentrum_lima.AAC.1
MEKEKPDNDHNLVGDVSPLDPEGRLFPNVGPDRECRVFPLGWLCDTCPRRRAADIHRVVPR